MANKTLKRELKIIYNKQVSFIKKSNIEYEREELGKKFDDSFYKKLFIGFSFEDYFSLFKIYLREEECINVDRIFEILKDCFFFSENDFVYRKKLKVDAYCTTPLVQLISPILQNDLCEHFGNASFNENHPEYDENKVELYNLISIYLDFSALLNFLYYNNFCFIEGWEGLCSTDSLNSVLDLMEKSKITSNDYLKALINYKCDEFIKIMNEVKNDELRSIVLNKINALRDEKISQVEKNLEGNIPIIDLIKLEKDKSKYVK